MSGDDIGTSGSGGGDDAPDREAEALRSQGPSAKPDNPATGPSPAQFPGEVRGPKGPEPTRFGDWEKAGRCYDF